MNTRREQAVRMLLTFIAISALGASSQPANAAASYSEYVLRARFMEAMIYANPLKLLVAEYFIQHDGTWPSTLEQASRADPDDPMPGPSKFIRSASLGANGVLTVTFQSDVPEMGGKSVVFSPHADAEGFLTWTCSAPDIAENYRSVRCK
jgi:hypothetical protein